MDTPLDAVRFLAGSQNRVRVLERLRDSPASRDELVEEMGVSRPTLSRTLAGLEDRGWITRRGADCEITPLGAFFVDAFATLLEAARTAEKLRGVEPWLPTEEIGVGLGRFEDAAVTSVTPADPTAPIRRAAALARAADDVRCLTNSFVPPIAAVLQERTVHGGQTVVAVITDGVVRTIESDPEISRATRDAIEAGAAFYRLDDHHPYNAAVVDGTTVALAAVDDEGIVRGLVETDDAAIRSWVDATIERHRQAASSIEPDTFTV
jgi:DNA-binding transcriptional ArsR family regulator